MALVEIYYQNAKIDTEDFEREFCIAERLSGELFWYTGEQPKTGGGVLKTWIQMADTEPRIVTVLPDWQLSIDGVMQESRFYDTVENLRGKIIELRHRGYLFVINFA